MQPVDTDIVILTLRMLGHQLVGAQGMTELERAILRQAASLIQQMHDLGTELADALSTLMDDATATGQAFTALSHWHHRHNPATPTT